MLSPRESARASRQTSPCPMAWHREDGGSALDRDGDDFVGRSTVPGGTTQVPEDLPDDLEVGDEGDDAHLTLAPGAAILRMRLVVVPRGGGGSREGGAHAPTRGRACRRGSAATGAQDVGVP